MFMVETLTYKTTRLAYSSPPSHYSECKNLFTLPGFPSVSGTLGREMEVLLPPDTKDSHPFPIP